jgi:hypothetical protein
MVALAPFLPVNALAFENVLNPSSHDLRCFSTLPGRVNIV